MQCRLPSPCQECTAVSQLQKVVGIAIAPEFVPIKRVAFVPDMLFVNYNFKSSIPSPRAYMPPSPSPHGPDTRQVFYIVHFMSR